MAEVEIGIGKSGRRAYELDDVAVVPSRRTRDPEDIDVSWALDGYHFDLPVVAAAMDSVTSPSSAIDVARLGGLGVLDLAGLWARHDDPDPLLAEIAGLPADRVTVRLRELHAAPVRADLIGRRIGVMKEAGIVTAGAMTPQMVEEWHRVALDAGLDILVIRGVVVSAEHLSTRTEPLNLKDFIARYDIPVVVGGCASYATALHLMRTGAAGILVGVGTGQVSSTRQVLGAGVPLATAIADAAGARSRHLEETGRHVQIIADGGVATGGDIAKAIAVGADAVVLGAPLAAAAEAPGRGAHWGVAAGHATLPRGARQQVTPAGTLEEILVGPARDASGSTGLCAALARSMATCGYGTLKEFQRAEVVITG
ncbi:MAG TPA: GuaB3 family IMP dehydrogenase-related protein [Euzebya sp.]|nr:GuaB3 family IMP dehydrogenase-related protein [Euzebya sp.]